MLLWPLLPQEVSPTRLTLLPPIPCCKLQNCMAQCPMINQSSAVLPAKSARGLSCHERAGVEVGL